MTDEIKPIPDVPEPLRLAAAQGTLVPFIGAGVSCIGGCPDWETFATAALRTFVDAGKLDHSQFHQLVTLPPRTRLSIAVGLETEHKAPIDFRKLLDAVHDTKRNEEGRRIYGHLASLAKTFITTNYDEWLDVPVDMAPLTVAEHAESPAKPRTFKRQSYCRPETFRDTLLSQPDTVIHIHGSVLDRESMILTSSQYLERYSNHKVADSGVEENHYLNFLTHAFRTRSILFVGYSLSELEVLEYVIQKGLGRTNPFNGDAREEPKHHLLQGFFSHEVQIMRSLRNYYLNEFNVRLLPYSRDGKNWAQLTEVIQHLAAEIPVHEVLPSAKWLEMQELLS
jgi:hypothetical protein